MKSQVLTVLMPILLGTSLAGQAGATIINFDDVGDKTTITNQYAGVVFSSTGGDVVLTTAQNPPYTGSAPNLICTGVALPVGTVDCSHDLILNFTAPVNNLQFDAFGNQTPLGGTFALADIFQNGILTQTNHVLMVTHADHNAGCPGPPNTTPDCAADHQDLSAFAGITQLVIHNNTDTNGTAYDNFSFTAQAAPAPEPSTLFLVGLGGFVLASRRFQVRKSR